MEHIEGRPPRAHFDGHANCFIESGFGKGMLIDFNYETEPLPGAFPLPGVGPFKLLGESAINDYGKLMFRWVESPASRGRIANRERNADGGKAGGVISGVLLEQDRMSELDRKLDFILGELVSLRRLRESAEDFAADLALVGKNAMREGWRPLGQPICALVTSSACSRRC